MRVTGAAAAEEPLPATADGACAGSVAVEVLHVESGRAVPGRALGDAVPITGASGVVLARWAGGSKLDANTRPLELGAMVQLVPLFWECEALRLSRRRIGVARGVRCYRMVTVCAGRCVRS